MVVSPVEREQAPLLAQPYYGSDAPSPIVTSLSHAPEILDVTMPFVATVLGPSAIGARTKEMVILRTSALLKCSYCVLTHSVVALDSGLSTDEVLALGADGNGSGAVRSEMDRALLAWVDAVAGGTGPVAPPLSEALCAHFSEPEVVELTLLCAATVMLNRYCTALELSPSEATMLRLAAEGLA